MGDDKGIGDDVRQGADPRSPITTARPGRALGILRGGQPAKGFRFIEDTAGQEYFAHLTGFQSREAFDDLADGIGVSFRVSETPKGLRAFDIRPATDLEQAAIDESEDHRGNR